MRLLKFIFGKMKYRYTIIYYRSDNSFVKEDYADFPSLIVVYERMKKYDSILTKVVDNH